MSRNYKFRNPEGIYFIRFAVVVEAIKENPNEGKMEFWLKQFLIANREIIKCKKVSILET